jgi:hypothetical protein
MNPSWASTISSFRCALPKLRVSDCQLPITGQYQKHSPSSQTLQSPNLSCSDHQSPKVVEAQQRCFLFRCFAVPYHEDQRPSLHQQISSEKYYRHVGTVSVNHSRRSTFLPRGCRSLARGSRPGPRAESCVSCAVRICSSKIPVAMYSIEELGQSTEGLFCT